MTFTALQVKEEVVRALQEQGIVNPTNIQEKAIPLVHEGKDLIGISRTGSGKTASFGIPLLEKITPGKSEQALILAPTRELANQISKELQKWGKYCNINVAVVFGGVGYEPQVQAIRKSEIIVGTPGRILDHMQRGTLKVNGIHTFVLDEADKMVEMGFIQDVEKILTGMPKDRQILLFGATISSEIDYLKNTYMHNVAVAEAELQVKKDLLEQYYYNIDHRQKFSLLVHLIKKENSSNRVIIFCSKRSTVELVNKNLRNHGIKSEMIHGKMTQNKRLHVIERFNKGKSDYLVASSVAARGLDIKEVTHIFNYDLAQDPQEYIHRVGRTARAGESGKAITLLSEQDHDAFRSILSRYDVDVVELPVEEFPKLRFEVQRQKRFGDRRQHGRNFRGGHGHRREDPADKYGMTKRSSYRGRR